jgi:hypothetical protein
MQKTRNNLKNKKKVLIFKIVKTSDEREYTDVEKNILKKY